MIKTLFNLIPEYSTPRRFQTGSKRAAFRLVIPCAAVCLLLSFSVRGLDSATNGAAEPGANRGAAGAAADEALRAYLQLQEQMHEALLAIERSQQQSEDSVSRSSKALTARLQAIEESLNAQRASEIEAVQRANRTLLVVMGSFAALGCLAVLCTAYFQWRAVNRFTAISSALSVGQGLGSLRSLAAMESGEAPLAAIGTVEQSSARLLGALERLERRIQDLERVSRPALNDPSAASNILDLQPDSAAGAPAVDRDLAGSASPGASLLAKGQSLLNQAKLEEAIACFDDILAADPRNAEALVKKGTALERLRKFKEALECYDRAIAVDSSMTIAYLYKGGLCNRMERFSEALACYEQALHTQEKRRAS